MQIIHKKEPILLSNANTYETTQIQVYTYGKRLIKIVINRAFCTCGYLSESLTLIESKLRNEFRFIYDTITT